MKRCRITFFVFFVLTSLCGLSNAQIFINGGFEYGAAEGAPAAWVAAFGKAERDSVIKYSGDYSVMFSKHDSLAQSPGLLYLSLFSDSLLNRHIELKAKVKCELNDSTSFATLCAQKSIGMQWEAPVMGKNLYGNHDWTELTIKIEPSADFNTIVLGAIL